MANSPKVSITDDQYTDIPVRIEWTKVELLLRRPIPLKEKQIYVEKYGSYVKAMDVFRLWRRIATVTEVGALGFAAGQYASLGSISNTTIAVNAVTAIIMLVLIIIENFYRHFFVKQNKASLSFINSTVTKVSEGVVDMVKNPTMAALKKASNAVLPMLTAMWDYFFGEMDVVFSKRSIRRRRQLLLAGIISVIAYIVVLLR